ncbi:MAG: DUF7508 domain-containing protein [Dehalococcoidia bacterium]
MPLQKPWQRWRPGREYERELSNTLGVYEIADEAGDLIYIGFAGGRSLFGIRGELKRHFEGLANAVTGARGRQFRYEVNMQYMTRYRDLLQRFNEDHGRLPDANLQPGEYVPTLGRFHWKSPGAMGIRQ